MLAALLNVPETREDWDRWSFHNYDAISQITAAIYKNYSITLPNYQIWPIPENDVATWQDNVQQAHEDFTSILGQQSNNLKDVDLKDKNQREAWVWLNYKEIQDACTKLEIGP